jgi:hypothetical protein
VRAAAPTPRVMDHTPSPLPEMRSQLDGAGFQQVSILADDSTYYSVPLMQADPQLAAAVGYIGGHRPAPAAALTLGKPVLFSEDFHAQGGDPGAGTWASQINGRFLTYGMTGTLAWNAVDAFYAGERAGVPPPTHSL